MQIAAGRLVAKPAKQIAAETGLARTTVDHHAHDPRVSTLALRLKRKDEPRLEQAWDLAIVSVMRHLKSTD